MPGSCGVRGLFGSLGALTIGACVAPAPVVGSCFGGGGASTGNNLAAIVLVSPAVSSTLISKLWYPANVSRTRCEPCANPLTLRVPAALVWPRRSSSTYTSACPGLALITSTGGDAGGGGGGAFTSAGFGANLRTRSNSSGVAPARVRSFSASGVNENATPYLFTRYCTRAGGSSLSSLTTWSSERPFGGS